MIKISTSILSSNNRIESIKKLNNTSTNYIHIDVMDNVFVPNYQLPLNEVNELAYYSQRPFDIHLMMEHPEDYIKGLDVSNIDCITIHVEITDNIDEIIELIKPYNCHIGLAIKPNTDLDLLDKYLDKIDRVLIMSVEPGFGGQKFLDKTIYRINKFRSKKKNITIEVDGGINDETIKKISNIADIAVVGSYITSKDDYQEAINNLKN